MKNIYLLIGLLLLLSSCAVTYKSKDFDSLTKDHTRLAILPFDVHITPHRKDNINAESLKRIEANEAYQLQSQFHMRLMRKKDKYNYTVDFLEPNKVNAILEEKGISYENLYRTDYTKLCNILNVDGLIIATSNRTKPMSDGAAIAVGLTTSILFDTGIWGPTNETDLTLKIFEEKQGSMIWSYECTASGSVGSTPNKIAEYLARSVSRRFPYKN